MATYTENYNLTMPEAEDYYNVEDFNENFETIDTLMAENESNITEVNDKIGTPTEEGQTIFSLLQNNTGSEGLTAIKSIQHFILGCTNGQNSTTKTLDPSVVSNNCIVLMQPLTESDMINGYSLSNTALTMTHAAGMNSSNKFDFWVIEFC